MRVSVSHLQTLLTLEASTAKQEDSGDRLPSFPPSTTYFLHRSQLYMLSPAQGSKGQRSARDGDKRAKRGKRVREQEQEGREQEPLPIPNERTEFVLLLLS